MFRVRRAVLPPLQRYAQRRAYSTPLDEAPVPKTGKVWASADEAVKGVKSGDVLLSGGMSLWIILCIFANIP